MYGSPIKLGFAYIFPLAIRRFNFIIFSVPVYSASLLNDPAILKRMLLDLTAQLDKTNRLLRQLLEAKHATRSQQLSPGDRGGKTMAILRSFVSTCELVKIDPFAWFRDVMSRIGENSIQKLDELLPHRWAAARGE